MEIVRGEETLFDIDEVSDIVKETIERVLGGSEYLPEKVNRWTADIVDQILTVLTNLDKPFKYIVQSVKKAIERRKSSRTFRSDRHAKERRRSTYGEFVFLGQFD